MPVGSSPFQVSLTITIDDSGSTGHDATRSNSLSCHHEIAPEQRGLSFLRLRPLRSLGELLVELAPDG
jgi:hypothetical protein